MKLLSLFILLIALITCIKLESAAGCMKYGPGLSGQSLEHVECECNCDSYRYNNHRKCNHCKHYRAPRVYQINSQ